jgi:hypothetical protein
MRLSARRWLRAAVVFISIVTVGAWPSKRVARTWSTAMSAVTNPFLHAPWLAENAHAELSPVLDDAERAATDSIAADTRLRVQVNGVASAAEYGLTLRRDSYLPLLIFVALIIAAPVSALTKLACIVVGAPTIVLMAIGSVHVLVTYVLAHELPTMFADLVERRALLDFVVERWLSPPANRAIAPVLLAAGMVVGRTASRR